MRRFRRATDSRQLCALEACGAGGERRGGARSSKRKGDRLEDDGAGGHGLEGRGEQGPGRDQGVTTKSVKVRWADAFGAAATVCAITTARAEECGGGGRGRIRLCAHLSPLTPAGRHPKAPKRGAELRGGFGEGAMSGEGVHRNIVERVIAKTKFN